MALVEVFMVLLNSFIAIFVAIIVYYKNCYSFWKNKKVPYLTPRIPLGNSQNPLFRKSSIFEKQKSIYDRMKNQNVQHCGFYDFTTPIYFPVDLKLIESVLNEDLRFQNDELNGYFLTKFDIKTNFFNSSKDNLFEAILKCSNQMIEGLEKISNHPVDVKEIFKCFTLEVIKNSCFGLNSNGFLDDYLKSVVYKEKLFKFNSFKAVFKLKKTFYLNCFEFLSKFGVKRFENDSFFEIVKQSVKFRGRNRLKKGDFLQSLIDFYLMSDPKEISEEKIVLKALDFFSTSFKSTTTILTFCLYELAQNQDVQENLRVEILKNLNDDITYDSINDLNYLNQVIKETLRKYPLVPTINKSLTKVFRSQQSDLILEKGQKIVVPIFAIHRDSDFYPKPDNFEPERFSKNENYNEINSLPYLPFGLEQKSPIGIKFGLLQTKIALVKLLKHFEFNLSVNTTDPFRFHKYSFMLSIKDTIWLDVKKI